MALRLSQKRSRRAHKHIATFFAVFALLLQPLVVSDISSALTETETSDTAAPIVGLTDPSESLISGAVTVEGLVTDDHKLSHYNLSLYPASTDLSDGETHTDDRLNTTAGWDSGTVYTSDTSSTVSRSLDTTLLDDDDYQLRLAARDAAGNLDSSNYDSAFDSSVHVISFTVDNTYPVAKITAPSGADEINGSVDVTGKVTDENPMNSHFKIVNSTTGETVYQETDESGLLEHTFTWDSTAVEDGTYRIFFATRDAADNKDGSFDTDGVSVDEVIVIVNNTVPDDDEEPVDEEPVDEEPVNEEPTDTNDSDDTPTDTVNNDTETTTPENDEAAQTTSNTPTPTTTSTPTTVAVTPQAPETDDSEQAEPETLSTSDENKDKKEGNVLAATDEQDSCNKILGLCWYWWIPIGVALIGTLWFLFATRGKHNDDDLPPRRRQ